MPITEGLSGTGRFYDRAARLVSRGLRRDVTVSSLTTPTAATDLKTFTFVSSPNQLGNLLNEVGRGFQLFAAGTYNLGAASTSVFTLKLGGVTIATFTTASNANTSVTLNWQIDFKACVNAVGNAGTLEAHGRLGYDGGATLAAAASVFLDSNTAVSSAIDLTVPQTFELMHNFGTGNAASVVACRVFEITILQ